MVDLILIDFDLTKMGSMNECRGQVEEVEEVGNLGIWGGGLALSRLRGGFLKICTRRVLRGEGPEGKGDGYFRT